jgi:peptidoglycan/LPS O-acetylase OafA/YrhL
MSDPAPARIDELESLRGLAALPVVFFHLPRWNALCDAHFVRNGYLMVDLFFVLSGFVICSAYAERLRTPRDFLRFQFLRLGRLYPVHLLFLVVFLLIEVAKYIAQAHHGVASLNSTPFRDNDGIAFLENLLLVQSVLPNRPLTFNYPSWSISVEFATYTLFGVLMLLMPRARTTLLATVSAAAFALVLTDTTAGFGNLLHGFAGFFLGAVVARLAVPRIGRTVLRGAWSTGIFAMLTLQLVFMSSHAWDFAVPVLTALLIATLVLSRDGLVKRLLRQRVLVWLGTLSYSVYMSHAAVEWVLNQVVRIGLHRPLAVTSDGVSTPQLSVAETLVAFAVVLAAVLAVSQLVHTFVEAPLRARSRRFAARRIGGMSPLNQQEDSAVPAAP